MSPFSFYYFVKCYFQYCIQAHSNNTLFILVAIICSIYYQTLSLSLFKKKNRILFCRFNTFFVMNLKKKKNDLLELRCIHVFSLLEKSSIYFKLVRFNIVFNVVISLVLYTTFFVFNTAPYFYIGDIFCLYIMDQHKIPLNLESEKKRSQLYLINRTVKR